MAGIFYYFNICYVECINSHCIFIICYQQVSERSKIKKKINLLEFDDEIKRGNGNCIVIETYIVIISKSSD